MTDRALRHLLTDITGNTHRAEFCIDKLYSPDSARGRLGLLELRGFEMPPHCQMAMVQSLLVRSLVAWFWDEPLRAPLIRHGANLHGRYLLPHFVIHDIADVAADLRAHGIDFDTSWLDPFTEFRFPRIGTAVFDGVEIELRGAIEPWNVLGEEATAGGTARYVDSSVERIQVRLIGADRHRYVVTCNGYPVPLLATDNPDIQVGGVRFRAWQPPSALHPTITVDGPLRFELVDTAHRGVPRRLHVPRVASRRPVLRRARRSTRSRPSRGAAAASRRPASPRARSTCPTSGRSRPGNPPTWARRASSICAACVPFCSNGTSRRRCPERTRLTIGDAGAADARRRRCWPGTAPRAPRRRCSTSAATARPPATTNSSTRQATSGRPGRSWPSASRERGRGGLDRLRSVVRSLVDNDGITYIQVDHGRRRGHQRRRPWRPAPWHLDALPLLISAADWDVLEAGLVQRSRLLDAVLADLYGRAAVRSPRACCRRSWCSPIPVTCGPPAASRCRGGTSCSCTAATSAGGATAASWSTPTGRRRRRERATRWPTAASSRTPSPTSTSAIGAAAGLAVRAGAAAGADRRGARRRRGAGGGGAQSRASTPRPRSTRPIWPRVLGFPLVESADLVVRDGKLWMRSLGTLKRVDVVLRRVDADYADPLDLRADSRLGVVGTGRGAAPRRGDGGQHAGQRHPGKPWAASLSARAGRAAARRDAAAGDRAGVLGRHRRANARTCWRTCRRC